MKSILHESDSPPLPSDAFFRLARRHRVPGAQLAVRHGGRTSATEFGELEFGTGRPVTRDAAFPVGSITKSFTATVAMILAADGDLDPDAPVGDYVPELGELGLVLTLRHLLSHTSGLIGGPGLDEVDVTLARYVAELSGHEHLVLPPGTGFSYSNTGYAMAGRLIEALTGMCWHEAVAAILLRPLGIQPAFAGCAGTPPAQRPVATGHSVNIALGRTRPVPQSRAIAEVPAGGLAVSAADLVALASLHVAPGRPRLLPAVYAEQMRRAVPGAVPFGLADGWGLGLAVFRQESANWYGHDGNADGTACYLRVDPAGGWAIALTSNANTGVALWQDLLAELAATGIPIGPPRLPVSRTALAAPPAGCAGRYTNGDVEYLVTAENGSVHLCVDGEMSAPLTFHEDLAFSLPDPASGRQVFGGCFVRDPATNEILGIQSGGRFARRRDLSPCGASNDFALNAGR